MLLQVKLQQAVHWVAVQDKGDLLLPTATNCKMVKLLVDVLVLKQPTPMDPTVEAFQHFESIPTLIGLYITSNIVKK